MWKWPRIWPTFLASIISELSTPLRKQAFGLHGRASISQGLMDSGLSRFREQTRLMPSQWLESGKMPGSLSRNSRTSCESGIQSDERTGQPEYLAFVTLKEKTSQQPHRTDDCFAALALAMTTRYGTRLKPRTTK